MKDLFGNQKPVAIEIDEWWFSGRIIMKQNDCRLPNWVSFCDDDDNSPLEIHANKRDAVSFALKNPYLNPKNYPQDYIMALEFNNISE
jgi:hypothetical protein